MEKSLGQTLYGDMPSKTEPWSPAGVMSYTCNQCQRSYNDHFRVGNGTDGAIHTICSNACYQAWINGRQTRREKQDQGGIVQLAGILLSKMMGRKA